MDVNWTPQTVAAVLAFIGMLVFVHELGHFLTAKFFDIKVLKFSLGFGPPLVAFTRGETTYQIAVVPLGGFVKMAGDNPHEEVAPEDQARSFMGVPVYQRAIVSFAGPAMNLLFPVLCFFAYNLLEPVQQVAEVGTVEPGTPAAAAGLQRGDRIRSIDGDRVWSFERMTTLVRARPDEPLPFEVERGDEVVRLEVTPAAVQRLDMFGKAQEIGQIGVGALRPSARIGVFDRGRLGADLRTGDRILAVDGRSVQSAADVDRALARAAGRTVPVTVARPEPLAIGALVTASPEVPVTVSVAVPAGAAAMDALGLAPSGAFIRQVAPAGPAAKAGLEAGDRLVSVEGKEVRNFWAFQQAVETGEGAPIRIEYQRDGRVVATTLEPAPIECIHPATLKPFTLYDHGLGSARPRGQALPCEQFGLAMAPANWFASLPARTEAVHLGIGEAFILSFEQTWNAIVEVASILSRLFTGQVSHKNIGSPIQLFKIAAMAAERGVFTYLFLLAVISVQLAFINLLPIPVLDGGHLMFCLVEAVKRQPVSMRVREVAMLVGMVFLVGLFALAFSNDLGLF